MGVESRNVPTDSCKFPTEQMWLFEILFCHKFSQNVEIAAPNYVFSATTVPDRNVPTDRLKFNKGGAIALVPCDDATVSRSNPRAD